MSSSSATTWLKPAGSPRTSVRDTGRTSPATTTTCAVRIPPRGHSVGRVAPPPKRTASPGRTTPPGRTAPPGHAALRSAPLEGVARHNQVRGTGPREAPRSQERRQRHHGLEGLAIAERRRVRHRVHDIRRGPARELSRPGSHRRSDHARRAGAAALRPPRCACERQPRGAAVLRDEGAEDDADARHRRASRNASRRAERSCAKEAR